MIIGTGIDIEVVGRFEGKKLVTDSSFLEKIFTKNELSYCFSRSHSAQHLAARFAAKEAVIKALQTVTARGALYPKQIEVVTSKKIPEIVIFNPKYRDVDIYISLTHTEEIAAAMVLAVNKDLIAEN